MVPIDTAEALAELKAGRIDAMFYVAGYPVKLLTEDVTDKDGLALIPITNKSIVEFYPSASIPAGTYAWQPAATATVAAKAVLVSFDFRRKDCDLVGKMAQTVSTQPGLAAEERASEVEGRRSQLPAAGLGAVRLRAEVSRQGGGARPRPRRPSSRG